MRTNHDPNEQLLNKRLCAHCESELNKGFIEDDSGNYFCCEGCRSVYNLINNQGFSSFYTKRSNWQAKPVDMAEASAEYFQSCVNNISGGFCELTVVISGVRCAACIWLIENSISKEQGIESVRMNYANHKAKIVFNPKIIDLDNVLKKITNLGYCPLPYSITETASEKERKDYFYRFGTAAFFSMQLMIYSAALYAGYFQGMDDNIRFFFKFLSWFLATPVILYSGLPFFKNSLNALKHGHFTMDSLVAIGSGSAYLYSIAAIFLNEETYFDTSATIITLILLGRFIEAGVKQKNSDAVKKLLSLNPTKVKVISPDKENGVVIPISQLKNGDLFEVTSGSAIAADGIIMDGEGDIDESMLTGEPIPIHKGKGGEIFAGTKCLTGNIVAKAVSVGKATFLSKIAESVEKAQESKAPIQDVADKFIGKFVPFVLIVAAVTFICWFFAADESFSSSLMKAVSVLVIACPCAMGLATPLAIITASSKLSETGIVFKNGESIERYAGVNDFYFDKTGTFTEGRMTIQDMKVLDSSGNERQLIASSAVLSKHPASKAIAVAMNHTEYINPQSFKDIPAKGTEAIINGISVISGSLIFMKERNIDISSATSQSIIDIGTKWQTDGNTIVYSAVNGTLVAVFSMTDIVRSGAVEAISSLKEKGNRVSVLTGDNLYAAKRIIENSKIDISLYAGLSPFDKSEIINNAPYPEKTAMIGDGINDAIALSASGVGIAMREGTDISIESADAVMLRSDLKLVAKAHMICGRTLRIIKENLFWAFSYNIIAIPLAVSGLIHPVMSAAFMSFSSLFVVLNSLRIKRF